MGTPFARFSAVARKRDGLEMERAEAFAAREVLLQRLGLGVLFLFVTLGAAGLFGNGPLSAAHVTSGNLSVQYERFTRQTAAHAIVVEATTSEPTARISFDEKFFEHYTIQDSRPLQVQSESVGDQLVFKVPTRNGIARLELHLEASGPGVFSGRVGLEGGASTEIRQVVFF